MCALFKLRCNLFFPESPQLLSVEKRSDVKRICTAPCTTARQVIGLTRPLAKAAGKVDARDIIWSGHRGEAKDGQGLVPAQNNSVKHLAIWWENEESKSWDGVVSSSSFFNFPMEVKFQKIAHHCFFIPLKWPWFGEISLIWSANIIKQYKTWNYTQNIFSALSCAHIKSMTAWCHNKCVNSSDKTAGLTLK